ncbi:MAG TPA: hypothetical protein VFQ61_09990 [Polyangiaceae bacterium]|nr:hypothetical protein [Polyangiaceae bacterium]
MTIANKALFLLLLAGCANVPEPDESLAAHSSSATPARVADVARPTVNPRVTASRQRFAESLDRYRRELVARMELSASDTAELLAILKEHDDARMRMVAELDTNPGQTEQALALRADFAAVDPAAVEERISVLLGNDKYRKLTQLRETREQWLPAISPRQAGGGPALRRIGEARLQLPSGPLKSEARSLHDAVDSH